MWQGWFASFLQGSEGLYSASCSGVCKKRILGWPVFGALFSAGEAAGIESQPLLVAEHKMPEEGSIFILNLVSWWARKLLPVKIATLAKKKKKKVSNLLRRASN